MSKAGQSLHTLVNRSLEERQKQNPACDRRWLAGQLGVSYRGLSYWLAGERRIPADVLPKLCKILDTYVPLDQLEEEVGRVAYRIVHPEIANNEDLKRIQKLVKEVGEALEVLARTLEDGIVEEHELAETLPQLDDVIRECASLKHWLEKKCAWDKQKRRTATAQ